MKNAVTGYRESVTAITRPILYCVQSPSSTTEFIFQPRAKQLRYPPSHLRSSSGRVSAFARAPSKALLHIITPKPHDGKPSIGSKSSSEVKKKEQRRLLDLASH